MKAESSSDSAGRRWWFAITADQRRSQQNTDRVPAALTTLSGLDGLALGFERTAGDELQGLTDQASAVVAAVSALTRLGEFRIGVGVGTVEEPLPGSTREARGAAYVAARLAVDQHSQPVRIRVSAEASEAETLARHAETALLALVSCLARRSPEGWQVVDLVEQGLSGAAAASRLGITPSAVSQRLRAAEHQLVNRLADLCEHLLGQLPSGGTS
ncbi:LysR family transcriptional regulator [Aestuariimicrobium sp. T2.26MG-19.2B]|uniref:LysR family transcriptional regulator n=1 Tax=Aestuariimicrobium sp. T2.26MG-19.2B TaxID=3040679 RepID=UPI002477B41F|nr:LysR family transcriptional regulator [Aestuariimicrobium sp. T2.26MG-19.2B]CAI9409014.1 hypothetical protein AESSP_02148 [Aestuariimicrobium sp. T2.26MG-19.2B]